MIEWVEVTEPHTVPKTTCDLPECDRFNVRTEGSPSLIDQGWVLITRLQSLPENDESVDPHGNPRPMTWPIDRELSFCSWTHLAAWAAGRAGHRIAAELVGLEPVPAGAVARAELGARRAAAATGYRQQPELDEYTGPDGTVHMEHPC